MWWSSLTLLYLHFSSPVGNKSVLSGLTIPNRDIWKVSGGRLEDKLWLSVGYGSSISQVSINSALQCCGSPGHVFTLLPHHTSNWVWPDTSKCTIKWSKPTTCGCSTEDFVMPLHFVAIKSFYVLHCLHNESSQGFTDCTLRTMLLKLDKI